tara:strand:+ start:871 stop:1017 length:147 start_codon:yes stop_codon:yes gene_type:complete
MLDILPKDDLTDSTTKNFFSLYKLYKYIVQSKKKQVYKKEVQGEQMYD